MSFKRTFTVSVLKTVNALYEDDNDGGENPKQRLLFVSNNPETTVSMAAVFTRCHVNGRSAP